jgi:hypothetical protein
MDYGKTARQLIWKVKKQRGCCRLDTFLSSPNYSGKEEFILGDQYEKLE